MDIVDQIKSKLNKLLAKKEHAASSCESGRGPALKKPEYIHLHQLQDLPINGILTHAQGCSPLSGFGAVTAYMNKCPPGGCFPQNGEFQVVVTGADCRMCAFDYGCDCGGSGQGADIEGKRMGVQRVAYNGDAKQCCINGGAIFGDKTCNPAYRNINSQQCIDLVKGDCKNIDLESHSNVRLRKACVDIVNKSINNRSFTDANNILGTYCSKGDNIFNKSICKNWALGRINDANQLNAIPQELKNIMSTKSKIPTNIPRTPVLEYVKKMAKQTSEFDQTMIAYCQQNPTNPMCSCILADTRSSPEPNKGPPVCIDPACVGGAGALSTQLFTNDMESKIPHCKYTICNQIKNIGAAQALDGGTITMNDIMYCGVEPPKQNIGPVSAGTTATRGSSASAIGANTSINDPPLNASNTNTGSQSLFGSSSDSDGSNTTLFIGLGLLLLLVIVAAIIAFIYHRRQSKIDEDYINQMNYNYYNQMNYVQPNQPIYPDPPIQSIYPEPPIQPIYSEPHIPTQLSQNETIIYSQLPPQPPLQSNEPIIYSQLPPMN